MVTSHNRKSFELSWKKIQNLLRRPAWVTFLIRVQAFRDPLGRELLHVQIFMNDGPNPLTWDSQLFSYWFRQNLAIFQDYLVNLINNLRGVHCLGSPGRGTSQVEISPHLKWATQFLKVPYNGACSPNVSVRMAWISFGTLPCRKRKLDGSSRLNVVEIVRVAWHASFQPL